MTVLPGGGKAAGEGIQDLWSGFSLAHGTESRAGRPRAAGLPAPPRSHFLLVFEQDVPQLPLVKVIAMRRGVRQPHEMTARCGPRSGRFGRREPLARELSSGARARERSLRHFRRRNFAAEHLA